MNRVNKRPLARGVGVNRFGAVLFILCARWAYADFAADLANASRPIEGGVPQAAIVRLQALLQTDLTPDQRRRAGDDMVRALVAAKRPAEALNFVQQNQLNQSALEKFWQAQALADLGRWNEALPFYEQLARQSDFPLRANAVFGTAEMFRALNRPDDAIQMLTPLLQDRQWQTRTALLLASLDLDKNDPENAQRVLQRVADETPAERKHHRFLRGRLELVQRRPDRALSYLEPLVKKPREVSHPLVVAALFLIADAHLQLRTPETGDDLLEDFIEHHPTDEALPELFAKLDELYRAERKPVRAELERWTRETDQPRRGLAQWYLARIELRGGRRDHARQILAGLRASPVKVSSAVGGLFELAEMEFNDQNFGEAIALSVEADSWSPAVAWQERFQFLASRAQYAKADYQHATDGFEQLGRHQTAYAIPALYNASLGWLQLSDHDRALVAASEMQKRGGTIEDGAELRLQEGLLRARQQKPDAAESLHKFIADFPQNPRVSEALVALAELAFHQNPPRPDDARKFLARAAESQPTAAAKERSQYLTIWIEDSAGDQDKVIELAKQFLARQPGSEFAAEVRMKLAEAYYLRQDFANAQTQFELFAQQNPASSLTEKALFFAGESAMATMAPHTLDRAIVLFDEVAQMKGDLRWAARNEQALIERKLGKPQDALLLYDEVLKNDAHPGEKREALCGKGDIYFELSTNNPKNYERAVEAYDQLAATTEPGHWRNQALFKKGICLEKKSDRTGALETFYQVLDAPTRTDRRPELFWFYKAGFNAARLLEADSHWDSAVKVYQKLAAAGGSRSEEAKIRLNQLRLEHFLWSE